jgi:hypothetical protein
MPAIVIPRKTSSETSRLLSVGIGADDIGGEFCHKEAQKAQEKLKGETKCLKASFQ